MAQYHKLDKAGYDQMRLFMSSKYGHYIHDFMCYWQRVLVLSDKTVTQSFLPFYHFPADIIIYWAKHILHLSDKYIDKVSKLKRYPLQSPIQLQGMIETHYRCWTKPLYVHILSLYNYHIFNI